LTFVTIVNNNISTSLHIIAIIVAMHWKEKLGEEIRKARNQKGLTQERLQEALQAAGLELSLTTLKAYESGKWAPSFGDLRTIAHVLETDYFEIDQDIRVDFSRNGSLRLEPLPQQLTLDLDSQGNLNIRRSPSSQGGAVIKRIRA
jgi:transcriptional regulator with XRE-family HTH domain